MKSPKARSYLKNALSIIPTKMKRIYIRVMTFEIYAYKYVRMQIE